MFINYWLWSFYQTHPNHSWCRNGWSFCKKTSEGSKLAWKWFVRKFNWDPHSYIPSSHICFCSLRDLPIFGAIFVKLNKLNEDRSINISAICFSSCYFHTINKKKDSTVYCLYTITRNWRWINLKRKKPNVLHILVVIFIIHWLCIDDFIKYIRLNSSLIIVYVRY